MPPPVPSAVKKTNTPDALAWDAKSKDYKAKEGESTANFTFYFTNVSSQDVTINSTETTCGCTVAKLAKQPWKLAPGDQGKMDVTVNLQGKAGLKVIKGITVLTTAGSPMVLVNVDVPLPDSVDNAERKHNFAISKTDPQAIFKGSCAECHATPAKGRMGNGLYVTACAICHDSVRRASTVPDLRVLNKKTDPAFWKKAVVYGRPHTAMPAFAQSQGGILNDAQVETLVEFLDKTISRTPAAPPKSLLNGYTTDPNSKVPHLLTNTP